MKIPFELAISLGSEEYTTIPGITEYEKKIQDIPDNADPSVRIRMNRRIQIKINHLPSDNGQRLLSKAGSEQIPARFKEVLTIEDIRQENIFLAKVIYNESKAIDESVTSRFTIIQD